MFINREVAYDVAKRKRKWKLCYGLRPVGKTHDGKTVVSGFDTFKMHETIGIPLDLMIDQLYNSEILIDWWDFFLTGLEVGWTFERLFFRIESSFEESQHDGTEVIKRLKELTNVHV